MIDRDTNKCLSTDGPLALTFHYARGTLYGSLIQGATTFGVSRVLILLSSRTKCISTYNAAHISGISAPIE